LKSVSLVRAMDSSIDAVGILIVDDHPTFRYGLRKLLESQVDFRVLGESSDGVDVTRLVHELKPDVVLLDLSMPRRGGLEVLADLSANHSATRPIVLAAALEKNEIAQAFRLGARGVMLKESATELIIESIRCVMKGQYWVGRENVSDLVQLFRRYAGGAHGKGPRERFGLSARELEVVTAVVAGYSNREIGQKLSLSVQTVKHHITNIFDKLGVSNRMELTLFAVNHHLVDDL
jgi:two-component system, NarL family, nitrate/nitrite response regulator NarL